MFDVQTGSGVEIWEPVRGYGTACEFWFQSLVTDARVSGTESGDSLVLILSIKKKPGTSAGPNRIFVNVRPPLRDIFSGMLFVSEDDDAGAS